MIFYPKKRILLLHLSSKAVTPASVYDHIKMLTQIPGFKVDAFNVAAKNYLRKIHLGKYQAIIIHNTLSYNIDNVRHYNQQLKLGLENYSGVKVLMKQDEMLKVNKTVDFIKEFNFNLLLTCLDHENIEKVYQSALLPHLNVLPMLTGYVNTKMRCLKAIPLKKRDLDIVYRGMKCPYNFGKLSYEKFEIGEKFIAICQQRRLKYDISSSMDKRIYGDKWYQFLASSRAVLGVESGASIFDFTGELENKTNEYLLHHPEADFTEVHNKLLKDFEGNVPYHTVSPRHFEAAATKTVQILYEGEYANIFKPGVHYLSLKKDYSNIDAVIQALADDEYCQHLTENAYKDIIQNSEYSYETLLTRISSSIHDLV